MSIESPVGTLDIKNATLRVGKLEVSNIQGIDTALNVTRANSVLIYDDQASTTTFTGTTSSAGVRDTVNGYLDVAGGYVYWGQKLPNSWVMDFEMDIRSGTNAGSLNLNVFSSINTGSDGYSIVFDDNGDNIILKYDGTQQSRPQLSRDSSQPQRIGKRSSSTMNVALIAISLGGERKLYYQDIERETPYTTGEYINFSSASADGRKIRDLKITNGSKWIYAGESNVVYTQGSVGVGVTDPTTALDVSGTVKATALEGDGSAITNISSANVGDFASNVTRIETLETDLSSNATRVSTLETDLGSNVTRIETLETGNMTISGQKTFSGDVIFESNVHMQGDVFVANTVNMTVSDPIIELGSNNLNTGDLGIIMTRHGATNSNIAIVFDESADVLRMGYTLGGASDADITLDSNVLAVSVQGALTAASVSGDGSGLSSIQSSNVSDFASNVGRIGTLETDLTSNVGRIGTLETDLTSNVGRIGTLETDLTSNVTRITNLESSDMTIGGEKTFSSNLQVGTANLFVDTTTSNVGVGTSTPGYALDVVGDINLSGDFYQGGSIFVSSLWTSGNGSLYYDASNVGIGTNTANYELDVVGNVNATTLLANTAQIHSNLTVGSNVTIDDTASNVISVDGNIKADTFNVGDFVVVAAYGLDHVTNENNSTGDTIISTNPITGFRTLSNIVANGNVTATDLLCNTLTMNLVSFTGLQTFDQVTNVGNTTSNTVQFTNTNTSLVTLGNVGIGTTSPGQKLSIYTGSTATSALSFDRFSSGNYRTDIYQNQYGPDFRVGYDAYTPESILYLKRFSDGRKEVEINGNVGIGTTSPSAKLHINTGATENAVFTKYETTGNGYGGIEFRGTRGPGTGGSTIGQISSYWQNNVRSRIIFNDGGDISILPTRNVGIGTASPATKLHIYDTSTEPTIAFQHLSSNENNSSTNVLGNLCLHRSHRSGVGNQVGIRSIRRAGTWDDQADMEFYVRNGGHGSQTAMVINSGGNANSAKVGIGTASFDTYDAFKVYNKLHSDGDGKTTFRVLSHGQVRIDRTGLSQGTAYINTDFGSAYPKIIYSRYGESWAAGMSSASVNSDFKFVYGSTIKAFFDANGSNNVDQNFTGQHRTFIKDVPFTEAGDLEGLIVSADQNKYIKMSGGIEAGSNAITVNESLPIVSLSAVTSDKKCFGVVSSSEDPDTRKNRIGNFVSVSQKELGDTRVYINSVGEGAMWVTDINGPLESGDYITTSNVAGYGMKQDDDVLHNYTVAKITMDCDFEPATQPVQQIVKELSNVNYWVETTYTNVALEEYSNLAEENRRTVTTTRYSNDEGDISPGEYSNLESNVQATYSEIETVTYQKIDRVESTDEQEGWTLEVREELVNVLDEHGQLQWEDHPTDTEKAYKIRYLTADGTHQTDEANAVYIAAFVGCTYHCG